MQRKAMVSRDLLAIIVVVFGALGFFLWGIGLSTIGSRSLQWLGASIVALVGFLVAFLSRWLLR
jgi:hypothetical protein